MFDVAIIGAGVIGAMTARELSRYNLSVALLEKENDVACGASKANSGIIHGGFDPEPGTLKARMNAEGIELLYEACEQLNVPHRQNGSLVLAFSEQENETLRELYNRGLQNGITQLSLLSGDEARALEPALSPAVTMALLSARAGIVCPYELTIAAVGNAMENGVSLVRNFEVCKIEKDTHFVITAKNGDSVSCRCIFNCAGGYSDRISALAGDDSFSIIPRAGEYMLLDKSPLVDHTIFQVPSKEGKGILVTPTVDGNILTGPTAKAVDSPADTDTTPQGLETVKTLAKKSVPSVNFGSVITSFTGVRSSVKGGDFIIERSKKVDGLIQVAAIDSPGLTSCVAIARYAVNILREMGFELNEKDSFNPCREDPHAFCKMSVEQKNEFIKLHPAYGRIVCRCETVSEGEIVDAIHREPRPFDTDGIKRRTRSGMGRCQGGFCLPFVMELLARENGQALSDITKNGGSSNYSFK